MKTFGMLALAVISCPCHLPLLLALLGGTAIGTLLFANVLPVLVVLTIVFGATLALSVRALGTESNTACRQAGKTQ